MEGLTDSVISWEKEEFNNIRIDIIGLGESGSEAVLSLIPYKTQGAKLIITDYHENESKKIFDKFTVFDKYEYEHEINELLSQSNKEIFLDDYSKYINLLISVVYIENNFDTKKIVDIIKKIKNNGILTIAIIVMPLSCNGFDSCRSINSIAQFDNAFDIIIPIDRKKVYDFYNCKLGDNKLENKIIRIILMALIESVSKIGHVGMDVADLKYIFKNKGLAQVSITEFGSIDGKENIKDVINNNTKVFTVDYIKNKNQTLAINVTCGDCTIDYFMDIINVIEKNYSENAEIIYAPFVDSNFLNKTQIITIATGFEFK